MFNAKKCFHKSHLLELLINYYNLRLGLWTHVCVPQINLLLNYKGHACLFVYLFVSICNNMQQFIQIRKIPGKVLKHRTPRSSQQPLGWGVSLAFILWAGASRCASWTCVCQSPITAIANCARFFFLNNNRKNIGKRLEKRALLGRFSASMDTSVRCAVHLFESTALIYSKEFCCNISWMQFPNYIISVKTSFVIRNIFLTYVQSKFQVLCFL